MISTGKSAYPYVTALTCPAGIGEYCVDLVLRSRQDFGEEHVPPHVEAAKYVLLRDEAPDGS